MTWAMTTGTPRVPHVSPTISVIVPVFNVQAYVAEAIASLKAQSFTDFEALLIDDGSTDGSGDVAMNAVAGDQRFRVIRQENRGLSAARNVGLAEAQGAFVAFLDGDDAYAPEFLAALHAAILRENTDWAACGLSLWFADGHEVPRAAFHAPDMVAVTGRLELRDARDVVQSFPSAWNKLYRRSRLGQTRFPEGSWFEDHEVFWAFAATCPAMAYVPEALYRHRRDREGQITGTDSDRVFEQFEVLDRLRQVITSGAFTHGDEGFARLATRLIHERALVVRDRPRRARFISVARARMAEWRIAYAPEWDPEISRGLGVALEGDVPLSVVVIAHEGGEGELRRTLVALDAQTMVDFDLHVVAPPGVEVPECLASGLTVQRCAAAQLADLPGRYLMVCGVGERPLPDGMMWLLNLMLRTGAGLGFGGFERDDLGYHDGWTDRRVAGGDLMTMAERGEGKPLSARQALRVFPVLANRIVHRELARGLVTPQDLPGAQAFVWSTALAAGQVAYTPVPVAAVAAPGGRIGLRALAGWARALPEPAGAGGPRGWRGVLYLRLARLQEGAGGGKWVAIRVVFWALWAGLVRAGPDAQPDPETPHLVQRVWRMVARVLR